MNKNKIVSDLLVDMNPPSNKLAAQKQNIYCDVDDVTESEQSYQDDDEMY